MFTKAKLARLFNEQTGYRVVLRLHRNKTSWLSFRKEVDTLFLSLHEHFLQGDEALIQDVVAMLKGKKGLSAQSRAFLCTIDGTHVVVRSESLGRFWNLNDLYKEVEEAYFPPLNLTISWFGEKVKKSRRITLGQYDSSCKLIKIHWLLDSDQIPKYFLKFIIYHEILHSIYSPKPHLKGYLSIHPKEFKEKEKEFVEYKAAQEWLKKNKQKHFF